MTFQYLKGVYMKDRDFLPGPIVTGQGIIVSNEKRIDLN